MVLLEIGEDDSFVKDQGWFEQARQRTNFLWKSACFKKGNSLTL